MSLKNWANSGLFDSAVCLNVVDLDNSNSAATGVDVSAFPGANFAIVTVTTPNEVTDTGGTWTVTDGATLGGGYSTASQSESHVTTPGTSSVATQVAILGFVPNPDRPFVKPLFTKADTDADVTAAAYLLAYKGL